MIKAIRQTYAAFFSIVDALSIFFAIGMVIIMVYNVFMRYVMQNTPRWGDEMSLFCMIWFGLLSASIAMKDDRHIRVRFWNDILPPKGVKVLELILHLLACVVLIVLCREGMALMKLAGATRMSGSGWPLWTLYISLPISSVCMIIGAVGRSCEIIGRKS